MPFNGSGTFTVQGTPFAAGTTISAGAMNPKLTDVASGLTTAVTRDGQSPATADLPMGSFKHTNVGNATARNEYAALAQLQDGAVIWCGTAGGTANARTITPTPAIPAYAAGQVFRFLNGAAANTGAVTLAVSGLTPTAVRKGTTGAAALDAEDLPASALIEVLYDGSVFRLLSVVGFATVAAPLPRSAAGVGSLTGISVAAPGNAVLPSGGVWAYSIAQYVSGAFNNQTAGVAAGGTTILAGGAGISFGGWAWRIA